jgi:hypothetical protein
MWIFNKDGFFSVVQKPNQVGTEMVTVRSRAKKDLLNFTQAAGVGQDRLLATPRADYQYRVEVAKDVWKAYISKTIQAIDYDNFKHEIQIVDKERANVYLDVWSAMLSAFDKKMRR